jgi:hypothetical protein
MGPIQRLLLLAKAYGSAAEIELSTVSWRVFGDTKKLAALETGSDIQVGRYEKAVQWFSDNWPERARWPAAVQRPAPKPERASA